MAVGGAVCDTSSRRARAFATLVLEEVDSASAKHAPMNSLHEAYAVILEEMDELWDECKRKRKLRDHGNIHVELKQIAAMAIRAAADLGFHQREAV